MMNFSVDTQSVEYRQMEKDCLNYCNYRKPEKGFYDSMCELMAAAYSYKNRRLPEDMLMRLDVIDFKIIELGKNYCSTDLLRNIIDRFPLFLKVFEKQLMLSRESKGGYYFSNSLSQYILSVLCDFDTLKQPSIYMPFADGYLINFINNQVLFDCEGTNELYIEMAKVICNLSNNDKVSFDNSDSSRPINPDKVLSHNHILALPPFNPFESKYQTANIIDDIIHHWSPDTKAIVLCADNFLTAPAYEKHRRAIIINGCLSKIISLPKYSTPSIGVSQSLLVLDNSTVSDSVEFIDLSSINERNCLVHGVSLTSADYERCASEHSIKVKESDIISAGIMSPSFFLKSSIAAKEIANISNPHTLGEIISEYRNNVAVPYPVRVIRNSDLANAFRTHINDFSSCGMQMNRNGHSYIKLDKDCLLISSRDQLYPVLYKHDDSVDYYIESGVVTAWVLKSNATSFDYLISEFSKPYVQVQVEMYQAGSSVRVLSVPNLLKIRVNLPSLEEQASAVNDFKTQSLDYVAKELLALKDKEHNEYVRNLRTRKHAIGHSLADIDYSLQLIEDYIEMSCDNSLNEKIVSKSSSGRTVADCLSLMRSKLDTAIKQTSSLVDNQVFGSISEYNIVDVANEFLSKPQSLVFSYNAGAKNETILISPDFYDFDYFVNLNKDDLFKVFQEIIDNAVKYGFAGRKSEDNVIMFTINIQIDQDGQEVIAFSIWNNGNPLPEGMTPDRVFTWGECSASGTGIGGWQIKNIVEHFGGSVSIDKFSDDFPVNYRITLPVSNKKLVVHEQ